MKYRNFKQARAHGWTLKKFGTAKKISAAWRLRKKFGRKDAAGKLEKIKTIIERRRFMAGAKKAVQKGARRDYVIAGFLKGNKKNSSRHEFNYSMNFARTQQQVKEWVAAWKKKYLRVKIWQQDVEQEVYERWRRRTVKWAAKNLIELGWTYEPEFYASMFWLYPE